MSPTSRPPGNNASRLKVLNSRCRFDPYAQQKLEQREAAIKKFYKDEDGAADDEEAGEVAEEMQEAKETEGQRKLAGASSTGENSAPPLSSVFEEEDAGTEGNDATLYTVVGDTMARVNEVPIEGEARNSTEAEEKTSNEEAADTEMKTNGNTGATENNETLKLVLRDTLALVEDENQALNDTVEEKENESTEEDGNVEEKKVDGEEESLKLVLEPNTPIEEEEEIILSSQVGGNIVNLESLSL